MLRAFAGGSLFGEQIGTGTPWVLALHGWQRSHADFGPVLADGTAPGIDAVALDLPGFGASPPPPEAWGSEEYAEHVAPVLEELAPRVVVLGHSFGGRVALHLAAAHPDRVSALVLTGVPFVRPGGGRSPARRYRLIRSLTRVGLLSPARLEQARERHGSADYRAASGVLREVLVRTVGEDYAAVVGAIKCPVELVWGEQDRVAPLAAATWAQSRLGDARLEVVAGADHFTPSSAAAELRAALERQRP